jgi:DNA-directed RNA polymerase subunit RPC12/RpoP
VPDERPGPKQAILNQGMAGRTIVPREGYEGSPVPPGVQAVMVCSECGRERPASKFPTTDQAHRLTECRDCRDDRRQENLPPGELARSKPETRKQP